MELLNPTSLQWYEKRIPGRRRRRGREESNNLLIELKQREQLSGARPRGYWTQDDHKNIRKFFDDFATIHKFDPEIVENWYPINHAMVVECEVIHSKYYLCISLLLTKMNREEELLWSTIMDHLSKHSLTSTRICK